MDEFELLMSECMAAFLGLPGMLHPLIIKVTLTFQWSLKFLFYEPLINLSCNSIPQSITFKWIIQKPSMKSSIEFQGKRPEDLYCNGISTNAANENKPAWDEHAGRENKRMHESANVCVPLCVHTHTVSNMVNKLPEIHWFPEQQPGELGQWGGRYLATNGHQPRVCMLSCLRFTPRWSCVKWLTGWLVIYGVSINAWTVSGEQWNKWWWDECVLCAVWALWGE